MMKHLPLYTHRDSKFGHWRRWHLHLCSLLHRACACTCSASQMAAPAANLKRRHCHWPNFESLCVYFSAWILLALSSCTQKEEGQEPDYENIVLIDEEDDEWSSGQQRHEKAIADLDPQEFMILDPELKTEN